MGHVNHCHLTYTHTCSVLHAAQAPASAASPASGRPPQLTPRPWGCPPLARACPRWWAEGACFGHTHTVPHSRKPRCRACFAGTHTDTHECQIQGLVLHKHNRERKELCRVQKCCSAEARKESPGCTMDWCMEEQQFRPVGNTSLQLGHIPAGHEHHFPVCQAVLQ